ncbi:thyrotropin-releasing hormone-degrading ectoenzyme-like isoform X2 [Linepithema humile]
MIFQKLLTNVEIMLIATIALCTAINTENDTAVHYHLSDYIIPLHYDANLRFDYKINDIIGKCNITIDINRQIENITLYPVTFAIMKIVLYDNLLSQKVHIPKYSFNELNMFIIDFTKTPKLQKFLPPGRYTLMIAYMRHLNNNKEYFIQSLFSDKTLDNMLNVKGFDIMIARQLFPCWDEIALNSTFKISIMHHKNYTALLNMPIQTTENDKRDMMWTHFEKSPTMFIQHIKVVITTFVNISTSVANVTFWSRRNVTNRLKLVKCIAQQVLYFLKRENTIDKLPKIDYVAFWDTQHNNSVTWGLILQREADIIHDGNSDSVGHKLKVARLITNQIVSLWYNDVLLWSKRGFITFLATYILHQIFWNCDTINLFIVETQRESFLFDTPSDANKKNSLSYLVNHVKSSNIWRMLYHLVTADVFWTGIRTYLNSKQYNQTNDLWSIMQNVLHMYPDNSSVIIKKLISNWKMEKYYYPVLYVTRNFTNMTVCSHLSSDFIDKNTKHLSTFVTYTTKSIMNFQNIYHNNFFWLSPQKSVTLSENLKENDWIIVNLQQTGYYRVNYDTENWLKLAQYMNSTKYIDIHVLNRAQIIDDAFHFFIHKQLDYNTFWKISAFLSRETNYTVWYPMLKAFEYMTLIVAIKDANDVKEMMKEILSGVLYEIGYVAQQFESDLTECLRQEAVKWACIIGNKKCRDVANMQMIRDLYSKSDTFVTQSEWKGWMYCNGLVSANSTIWYAVWKKWTATPNDITILEYLTCSENSEIISNYLLLNLIDSLLLQHSNTRAYIFLFTVARHASNDVVCNFILQNLKKNTFMLTSNTKSDKIAILIVMITHQQAVKLLAEIHMYTLIELREERLGDAVYSKIKKRRLECARKVTKYGLIGLSGFK